MFKEPGVKSQRSEIRDFHMTLTQPSYLKAEISALQKYTSQA